TWARPGSRGHGRSPPSRSSTASRPASQTGTCPLDKRGGCLPDAGQRGWSGEPGWGAGAEAAQPQAVGHDEHRAERNGGGGDQRVEKAERGQRDGGGVIGEGPEQVAL